VDAAAATAVAASPPLASSKAQAYRDRCKEKAEEFNDAAGIAELRREVPRRPCNLIQATGHVAPDQWMKKADEERTQRQAAVKNPNQDEMVSTRCPKVHTARGSVAAFLPQRKVILKSRKEVEEQNSCVATSATIAKHEDEEEDKADQEHLHMARHVGDDAKVMAGAYVAAAANAGNMGMGSDFCERDDDQGNCSRPTKIARCARDTSLPSADRFQLQAEVAAKLVESGRGCELEGYVLLGVVDAVMSILISSSEEPKTLTKLLFKVVNQELKNKHETENFMTWFVLRVRGCGFRML